jgi:hypothetical protein
LGWTSGTVITATAGRARNSTNANDIVLAAGATLNAATVGANGLDIGALANSTMYAVYAIDDSYLNNPGALLLSTSFTSPLMPFGYDMFRRIGAVLTSGAAAILEFRQVGSGQDRWMWYDLGIAELSGGASATYVDVDCATSVPLQATMIIFDAIVTPTAAGDIASLQPKGATNANGYAIMAGDVAAVAHRDAMMVPCNGSAIVSYKVVGTLSLNTKAYLDQLAV